MVYAVILGCIAAVWWHERRSYRVRLRSDDGQIIAAEIEKILVWEFDVMMFPKISSGTSSHRIERLRYADHEKHLAVCRPYRQMVVLG